MSLAGIYRGSAHPYSNSMEMESINIFKINYDYGPINGYFAPVKAESQAGKTSGNGNGSR